MASNPSGASPSPKASDSNQRKTKLKTPLGWSEYKEHGYHYFRPDMIRPDELLGRLPRRDEVEKYNPKVLAYAPGCTPTHASGVDRNGVWYLGKHDVCPLRDRHQHVWDGGILIYNLEDFLKNHKAMREVDMESLEADREATMAKMRADLAIRKQNGHPSGPLVEVEVSGQSEQEPTRVVPLVPLQAAAAFRPTGRDHMISGMDVEDSE